MSMLKKHISAIIAFVLVIAVFVTCEPFRIVSAAAGEDIRLSKLYLKEVKMFYGRSESEAKIACESEGFIFCPTDLNEGSPNVVITDWQTNFEPNAPLRVYLGYKTTENPDNAITDLTLLDMKNSPYEDMDYQKFLDEHVEEFRNEATQMMVLVNELDRKMKAGSPNALMAYDSLNLIYVDESKSPDDEQNQLGYYLIHNADITFFEKFIQRGNSMILGRITDLLCDAAADYNSDGTTWIDRAKSSEVAYEYANGTSETKNMYDQICEDDAKEFIKTIKNFKNTYTEAKMRFDTYGKTLGYPQLEGMTEENSVELLADAGTDCRYPEYSDALKNYALLDAYTYQTAGEAVVSNADLLKETDEAENVETAGNAGTYSKTITLAEYIMQLANDETLEDHPSAVYPIIHALTQAQREALTLGGLGAIIEGLYQSKDYVSRRSEAINAATEKLKDSGYKDGRLYLWSGIDDSIYSKKVVKTTALKEAENAGAVIETAREEAEKKENSTLKQALMIIDICTLGYGGIVTVASIFLGSFWALGSTIISCAATNLAAGALGAALAGYVLGSLCCAMWVLNFIGIVVGFAMLIYSIFQWTGLLDRRETISFDNIPDIVFDARQYENKTYNVRYDAVCSNADESAFLASDHDHDAMYINTAGISKEHADINAFQSTYDRWITLYYSTSPVAGKPIEVTEGQEPFITKNDYSAPEGYRPLTLINGVSAENVNSAEVLFQDEERGRPELYVFFAGEYTGRGSGDIIDDDGRYVTNVRFSYSKNREDAINLLKKEGYSFIDTNLTPYDGYTFLGYQLGSSGGAVTDIRISNSGMNTIVFGDASYARTGADSQNTGTTPDGYSIYQTKEKFAGTPIVEVSVKTKRLEPGSGMEPVCLFSGGDAVDVGARWNDNILETDNENDADFFFDHETTKAYQWSGRSYSYDYISQDDPSNGIYVYFQPKVQYRAEDADGNPNERYVAGFSYFLAGNEKTGDSRFGTNYEFMQTFARENGFELVEENGEPMHVMSDQAGEMTMATMWRDVAGYPVDTYKFDQYHSVHYNKVAAQGDHGLITAIALTGNSYYLYDRLSRAQPKMIYHTAMYFGVSYTYNPYRAITGIAGLVTPYTETSHQIKYGGMKTPAGTFQPCNVSLQGAPIFSAGITAGYYFPSWMSFPLYTNYEARQKSGLSWTTTEDMEILSHYLLTAGPRKDVKPLKESDIAFRMTENPGRMTGFVPLCDLRTPGDYDHPMNLALDTTNLGSKYLYLYIRNNAGGREGDNVTSNVYSAKKYVAAVFCGVGSTPEEAISNLCGNAASSWATLAAGHKDIPAKPLMTEFDEIIPIDLSSEHPWYELHCNGTNVSSLENGELILGNEMAHYRWEGYSREDAKPVDEYEKSFNCAYVGVVRTNDQAGAAYGVLKYYTDAATAPETLSTGGTKCYRAGGPVKSREGSYFLYYSPNSGTANYQAPITGLHISDEMFINGYNTSFTVSESDRVDNALPRYGQLRMRTDEYKYIHLSYEREELPYFEQLYLGVGNTKAEAFADMVGTTNAYGAMDVNCNYNSFSGKWIAIGYRRTKSKADAITDIFIYEGEDPPEQINIKGGYSGKKYGLSGFTFSEYKDTKGNDGVPYKLLMHNLKSGAEIVSLNEGNGGPGLYIYYTTATFYLEKKKESEIMPITNICFTYGDISPRQATANDLAAVFERTYYAKKTFDASAYQDPVWECVLGVTGSPENWTLTADSGRRVSLNSGVRPGIGGNGWEGSDNRVYMYVDRAYSKTKTVYKVRDNCKLPEFGYYSAESTFGKLKQAG